MVLPIDPATYRGCSVCGQYTTGGDFCEAHDPAAPVTLAYTRINPRDGTVKSVAPPRKSETPWATLLRLGEQARDLNAVTVKPLNALFTHWLAETQRRRAIGGRRARPPYLVTLTPLTLAVHPTQTVCCDCERGRQSKPCGHVGAIVLDLQRIEAEAEQRREQNRAWNAAAMLTLIAGRFPDVPRPADLAIPVQRMAVTRNSKAAPAGMQADTAELIRDLCG